MHGVREIRLRQGLAFLLTAALLSIPAVGRAETTSDTNEAGGDCVIKASDDLRAQGRRTAKGHYEHEAWIAAPGPQVSADAVQATLQNTFGARPGSRKQPQRNSRLERGLIGQANDHHGRRVVVVVDPTRVDVDMLQAKLDRSVQRAQQVNPKAKPLNVKVREGCFSAAQLLEAESVLRERAWHPKADKIPYVVGLRGDDSRFHILLRNEDRDVAKALKAELGDRMVIEWRHVDRLVGGRFQDAAPHGGGAAISPVPDGQPTCTAGFPMVDRGGRRGSITAHHCYGDSQDLWSGSHSYGRTTEVHGDSDYPTLDMLKILPNGQNHGLKIYGDPDHEDAWATGREDAVTGEFICVGGMSSGSKCGIEVVADNVQACFPEGCTAGLFWGHQPGGRVAIPGDSGGTVYVRPTAGTAHIRGMVVGGTEEEEDVFAHHQSIIEVHLGLTVGSDTLAGSAATGVGSPLFGIGGWSQSIMSRSRQYRAVIQGDGNFVVYNWNASPPRALWSTRTNGRCPDCVALHQKGDGNVVLYDGNGRPRWASSWRGQSRFGPNFSLRMQDDGNLVNYDANNRWVWQSRTCQTC